MSINFLLQVTRILHNGDYDDYDTRMFYDYLKNLDNSVLIDYYNTCTVLNYNNDLELYIEVIDKIISILEVEEEYEKCQILLDKKNKSLEIMKELKEKKYEST